MEKSVKIRKARPSDLATIMGFILSLAEYEGEAASLSVSSQSLEEALFGQSPACECIIADSELEPIGFALYCYTYSTYAGKRNLYLEDLFVSPEARGLGVGKALLSYLAHLALKDGCGRFEWCVLNWNQPAIDLYRRIGASPVTNKTTFRMSGDALSHLAANVEPDGL